jgi:hypothetical protein
MPGSGSRHGAFCAIGGFLARCGMNAPEVKLFADAIVAAGGFDRDHTGHPADAAEAHRSGKHSYGYKTIAEIFGEKVAGKTAEWLGYKSGSDIGRPLRDCSRVPSSWITSQCSASTSSCRRRMSATIHAAGRPWPLNRPCRMT